MYFFPLPPAGSTTTESEVKKGYKLPRACMTNADVTRLINSDEVQSVVNAPKVRTWLRAAGSRCSTAAGKQWLGRGLRLDGCVWVVQV
jgi:hypothetical protein